MKPTVMTTGPGVIMATATASRNCWSSSQPILVDHAAVEKRHDGQTAAEDERAGLGEEQHDLQPRLRLLAELARRTAVASGSSKPPRRGMRAAAAELRRA